MSETTATTESFLCDKCSVLRFDDKALGFLERGWSSIFDNKEDEAQRLREVKDEEGDDGSSLSFDYDGCRNLQLRYHHTDLLPDFPGLEESVNLGCSFCMSLREAIYRVELNKTGRVVLSMRYRWREHPLPIDETKGCLELIVDFVEDHYCNELNIKISMLDLLRWSLRFSVDCEDGKVYRVGHCSLD
jgi:hypothetical protein